MPALQIRNLPDPVHRLLVERARLEHRSIAQQATVLLTEALAVNSNKERRRKLLAEIDGMKRTLLDFRVVTPPEVLVREDRNR